MAFRVKDVKDCESARDGQKMLEIYIGADDFYYDLNNRVLYDNHSETIIRLGRAEKKMFEMFLKSQGRVLSRDKLIDAGWDKDNDKIDETNLRKAIQHLRRALSDDLDPPRFIENIPGEGYRFIATIRRVDRSTQYLTPPIEVMPFQYGTSVSASHFYGRSKQILDVKNRIGAISPQCISIIGHRRSGKSSLLRYVKERTNAFCSAYQKPLIAHLDLQDKRFHTPVGIVEELRRTIDKQGLKPWQREANEDDFAVGEVLSRLRDGGFRVIMLLDEFDSIRDRIEHFQDWGEDARAKCTAGLFTLAIASKRPLNELYSAHNLCSPFANIFTETTLGALEDEAWRKLVKDGFHRTQKNKKVDFDLIEELAGGLPYYTQMAAALLWQDSDPKHVREKFKDQADERFDELWKELTPSEQDAIKQAAGIKGLAGPSPAVIKDLERHGLLRPDFRLFSSAFAEFVRA